MTTYKTDLSGIHTIDKSPDAELDYTADWTQWLADIGDTIATASVVATGVAISSTSGHDAPIVTGTAVTAWFVGGTAGNCFADFSVVTTEGRQDSRRIYFNIVIR
jgi:hypothetical protein